MIVSLYPFCILKVLLEKKMKIVNEITLYELIIPYISSVITLVTMLLYFYMDKKLKNPQYTAMRNAIMSIFAWNFFYLLMVHYVLHGQMKAAGATYALSQAGMTLFIPTGITFMLLLVDVKNKKLKHIASIVASVLYAIGFISVPLSLAAVFFDFEILHWGTRILPGHWATNVARRAVPEVYYSIRNVFYIFIGAGMITMNTYYCIKNRHGFEALILSVAYGIPLFTAVLDFFVLAGRPLLFSYEAHFLRCTLGTSIFALIAFLASVSMFVSEFFKIDLIRSELATVNIENNIIMDQVNKSTDTISSVQKDLSIFTRSLNLNSKSIDFSCKVSVLYTDSLLETNKSFLEMDQSEIKLYEESRKKIDSIYSSFEVLKKAIAGQASTLDSIVGEISDSSDILKNVEERITYLTKISNDLVNSYSRVKVSMLDSFEKLDSIVDITSSVKKSIIFIKDISEKTNILSINANIQASKSSAWEDSFGMVATEIGDLALDSTTAADKIDNLFLLVTQTTHEFILTKDYILTVFDSIIDNISSTMIKINLVSNIVSSQLHDNRNIHQNTRFARELNTSIALEIEKRYDEIYDVIQRFDSLDEQFEFFREQLQQQTTEITKLSNDMANLMTLSKELNSISQNITDYTDIIGKEISALPNNAWHK